MLHYKLLGKGKTVVFLHGYLENQKMWNFFADNLSNSYQVLLIDLLGHGLSEVYDEIHTMEFMAEKVNEVLVHLEMDRVVMIGHSMGGYVTLAFAEIFPEKLVGILLLNSTTLPDSDEKKLQRLKAVDAARKNLDTMIRVSIPTLFAAENRENLKEEIELAKSIARETPVSGVTAALYGMRTRADRTYLLNEFKGEIGLVIGLHDEAVNPVEFKKLIPSQPNIHQLEIQTGHMSHLESPEQTLAFIQDFLQESFKD